MIQFGQILSGQLQSIVQYLCAFASVCIYIFSRSSHFLHSEEAENRIFSKLLCNDASNVKPASQAGSPRTRNLWWHFQREPGFSKRLKPFLIISNVIPSVFGSHLQNLQALEWWHLLDGVSRSRRQGWTASFWRLESSPKLPAPLGFCARAWRVLSRTFYPCL